MKPYAFFLVAASCLCLQPAWSQDSTDPIAFAKTSGSVAELESWVEGELGAIAQEKRQVLLASLNGGKSLPEAVAEASAWEATQAHRYAKLNEAAAYLDEVAPLAERRAVYAQRSADVLSRVRLEMEGRDDEEARMWRLRDGFGKGLRQLLDHACREHLHQWCQMREQWLAQHEQDRQQLADYQQRKDKAAAAGKPEPDWQALASDEWERELYQLREQRRSLHLQLASQGAEALQAALRNPQSQYRLLTQQIEAHVASEPQR